MAEAAEAAQAAPVESATSSPRAEGEAEHFFLERNLTLGRSTVAERGVRVIVTIPGLEIPDLTLLVRAAVAVVVAADSLAVEMVAIAFTVAAGAAGREAGENAGREVFGVEGGA